MVVCCVPGCAIEGIVESHGYVFCQYHNDNPEEVWKVLELLLEENDMEEPEEAGRI